VVGLSLVVQQMHTVQKDLQPEVVVVQAIQVVLAVIIKVVLVVVECNFPQHLETLQI
jgi:hypothetical protein|tara:strand:+ start:74 stop:244 length:171 start_codon:yes stop_codon:yes gene_type:complete